MDLKNLKFDEKGLIPVIVQDMNTKEVLMLAYANEEAILKTIETGYAHYWSRSRNELWKKGETSGNFQKVLDIRVDCDCDTILYVVEQTGNACHTGNYSCFFRRLKNEICG
jgi:phosphoribosyl-AMP cyclohydrolase